MNNTLCYSRITIYRQLCFEFMHFYSSDKFAARYTTDDRPWDLCRKKGRRVGEAWVPDGCQQREGAYICVTYRNEVPAGETASSDMVSQRGDELYFGSIRYLFAFAFFRSYAVSSAQWLTRPDKSPQLFRNGES